ncbi:cytochrome c-type biogenesis protein CcmH [bacterium]|nr:cytochrome c-type biogenesis protein CcmH [bacterium]
MKRWLFVLLLAAPLAVAQEGLNPEQTQRFQNLIEELRCLVCQNQSIAESNAGLATDLRAQVTEQIQAGKTDAEIKAYLQARYGDFVLYNPPLTAKTIVLWVGPFVLVLGVLIAVIVQLRRRPETEPDEQVDRAALKKMLDE